MIVMQPQLLNVYFNQIAVFFETLEFIVRSFDQ